MENVGGRHIAQRIVVPAEVVVVDEVGNGPLQLSGKFISDLVYFPLDGLVVALQFPVGLRMEGRRLDMSDANEVQIVPKSSGDVTRPVVREQFFVRSSTGTSVMPVASTASWITSMRELAAMSLCSFQARMKRE